MSDQKSTPVWTRAETYVGPALHGLGDVMQIGVERSVDNPKDRIDAVTIDRSLGGAAHYQGIVVFGAESDLEETVDLVLSAPTLAAENRKLKEENRQWKNITDNILGLIGNIDHSKGNGPRAAKMRGDMLNDIRKALRLARPEN